MEPGADRQRSAAPAPQPSLLDTATGTGTIAVGSLIYDQTELTNVHPNVNAQSWSNPVESADCADLRRPGSGSVTVDMRPTPMTYAVNAKLTGADANQLLSPMST